MANKSTKHGVTSVAYTGGTAKTYVPAADPDWTGTTYVDNSDTNPLTRRSIRTRVRPHRVTKGGVVEVKKKVEVYNIISVIDATTGEIRQNSIKHELVVDPRDEATLLAELRFLGAQSLTDASFDETYVYGVE